MSTTESEPFNALAGNIVEQRVIDLYEWERDNESWHDAYCPTRDGYIEIKGCRETYPSGRTGRFQLYCEQHESLLEHGGYYAFAVYTTDQLMSEHDVERLRCVPVEEVDSMVKNWNRGARDRRGGREYKLGWTKVFDVVESV